MKMKVKNMFFASILMLVVSVLTACSSNSQIKLNLYGGEGIDPVVALSEGGILPQIGTPTRDDGAVFEGWYSDTTFDESRKLTPGTSRVKAGAEVKAKWDKCYAFSLVDGIVGPYGKKNQDWYDYYIPSGSYEFEFGNQSSAIFGVIMVCSNGNYDPQTGYPVLDRIEFSKRGVSHKVTVQTNEHVMITVSSIWHCQRTDVDAKYVKWVADGIFSQEMVWIIVLSSILALLIIYIAVSIIKHSREVKGPDCQKVINVAKQMQPTGLTIEEISQQTGLPVKKVKKYLQYLFLYKKDFSKKYTRYSGKLIYRSDAQNMLRLVNEDAEKKKKELEAKAVEGIVKVKILGVSAEKDTLGTIGGAVLGGIVAGGVGAIVGSNTGPSNQKVTLIIFYEDGHKESETVLIDSPRYKQLVPFFEL